MIHCVARVFAFVAITAVLFTVAGWQSTGGTGQREQPPTGRPSSDAQKEISALLEEYNQALLHRDMAALDRIWADDLTFINPRGELLSKQNRMDNIKSGATEFKSLKFSEQRIRVFGPVAVATDRVDLEAQYSGQDSSGSYRTTIVCAHPKDTWQIVAIQMTAIVK